MKPITSYRAEQRVQRDERIRHLHSVGDTSVQMGTRLGLSTSRVNEILRGFGLVPHCPHEGISALSGWKRFSGKERFL